MIYSDEMSGYQTGGLLHSFMTGVYGWMSCALMITAGVAYYVAHTPAVLRMIYANPYMIFLLFFVQIGLVIVLSAMIHRLTFMSALVIFLTYAASMGLTLSSIFHLYTMASIGSTFLTTAGMFGAMAVYGYMTRADLTTVGSMSMMVMFGLIIGLLVNMFFQNPMFDLVLSGIGVIIFALLTAYDTQKIKQVGTQLLANEEMLAKVTIVGALTLYLDFVNLFLFLLRFMGRRRE